MAMQQKWTVKQVGLDYVIYYKARKENQVANSLSRRGFEDGANLAITAAIPNWVSKVVESYNGDKQCQQIIMNLLLWPTQLQNYTYTKELLRYKGRIYIEKQGDIQRRVLQ